MKRALLLLLPLCLLLANARAQEWVEVRSPNLRMVSDTDTRTAQTALWRLEQVRTQFGHVLNRNKVNRNRPLLVFGLRSEAELNSLAGKTVPAAGFAVSAGDRDYLVMNLTSPDWSQIYRAYALLLLNANYPRTQPWFDEGIAQTLAGLNANENRAEVGAPAEVARTLQAGTLVPVSQLIAPAGKPSAEFRATSWLLIRWLQESNQLEAAAQYFGQVMVQHVPPEPAFTQSFSIRPKDLDLALAKFTTSGTAPKRIEVPVSLDKLTFASHKLGEVDSRAYKAQFRLEISGQREPAVAELKQLLAIDHDNVEVNRGLAVAYLREGDLKAAADHIRRSIELKDDSAEMHYLLAVYSNQGSGGAIQVDSAVPAILLEANRAVSLDPELANAYTLMAEAQLAMQRADLAAKSVNKAMALRPRDEDLLLTFASVQIANGKFSEAKGLLNFLKTSDDNSVAERATQMLAAADQERKTERKWANKGYVDPTEDKWKAPSTATQPAASEQQSQQQAMPDMRKVEFLKGMLLSVQCADKSATLKVSSGKKTWTFNVPDRSKALLIGADNFQCEWRDVPVSVNFKSSGAQSGEIVSLEVD
jgi:tetratricopeptide (TPR) repeat protein